MHPTEGMTLAIDKYSDHQQTGIYMNKLVGEFIENSPVDFTSYNDENPNYGFDIDVKTLQYTDFL